ncbi:MAG TPA: inositol monophosphatase family protein [Acidimicrobiia bacterium]|nr:inositol monophosphatase family protein [Acidimicrobiia bacterium]
MTPEALLASFADAADVAREAVGALTASSRRGRTDRPGQYDLDVVADAAVLAVLHPTGVAVVSEESGRSGPPDAPITVVLDPVDGSTNCSRGIPYWAISLCALDAEGPLCSLVRNQATGSVTTAVRGSGAARDGEPIAPSTVKVVGDAVLDLAGLPTRHLGWKQFRALGSAALALVDVAAGSIDGFVDSAGMHAPWDYLGGLLACTEAGASVVDADGRELVVTDPDARRQVLAASTPELLAELRAAVAP